jgi:hypothetical protein
MSTDVGIWFSSNELSLLGEKFVAGLPTTMRGCTRRAQREGWISRQVKGSGGPGGIRTEYQPPADVLALIHSFLTANPDFFAKSKTRTRDDLANVSKELFGDAPRRLLQDQANYVARESDALLAPEAGDRMAMLKMVLRMSEERLKVPPSPDVAKKIVDLADAWLPYCEAHQEIKARLLALRATAAMFV